MNSFSCAVLSRECRTAASGRRVPDTSRGVTLHCQEAGGAVRAQGLDEQIGAVTTLHTRSRSSSAEISFEQQLDDRLDRVLHLRESAADLVAAGRALLGARARADRDTALMVDSVKRSWSTHTSR